MRASEWEVGAKRTLRRNRVRTHAPTTWTCVGRNGFRQVVLAALVYGALCTDGRPLRGDEPSGRRAADATSESVALFKQTIAPLLVERCLECHAGAEPKGGLDLTRRERAITGGDSGAAIEPGNAGASLLWERIAADEMPPKKPLAQEEKSALKAWLDGGAAWGDEPLDPFRVTTSSRAGYDWWSLRPLADAAPPELQRSEAPRSEIDRFILRRLEDAGLAPAPPADPRTLVRRLYFDLIGLPADPEAVDAFAADPSDEAYARLVDRLLDSPRYGERWGRHWLDVARYGESDGFERNNPRKNAWPYRDWVIRSLNDDMPYDQFARMQLAGDILQPGSDGAAAVGFLVAGVHNTVVGQSERMKRLARQDELEEMIGVVGQTFLGLTVNCSRCHDHKFDPVTMTDYYRMIAAIDGVQHGERDVAVPAKAEELARVDAQLSKVESQLSRIDSAARRAILAERKSKKEAPDADLPQPIAAWDFDDDLRDRVGGLHGEAIGGAKLEDGALVVDGAGAYVRTAPLERELSEKTLEAWVQLANLDQRGGGVISVETTDGAAFDAIVFGEREPRRWMAGSEFFRRTQSFGGEEESVAGDQPIHMAIVYQADGTITAYRNGAPYGTAYKTGAAKFDPGKSHVVFGMRHAPAGSNKMLAGRILRAGLYDRALEPEAVAASAGAGADYVSERSIREWLNDEDRRQRDEWKARRDALRTERAGLASQAAAKMYSVLSGQPGEMRIHVRGDVTNFGDVVSPGGVAALGTDRADFELAPDAPDADRRRRLAEWIASDDNRLFARVIVNRVWHYHFGAGIVETPSDLGFNGGRPSHPELLDWLAQTFIADGWRLKSLHRRIVTTDAYRRSSQANEAALKTDANNRLFWRYSPRRVDGEYLRDAMLSVAGALNTQMGGPGFEDVSIAPNNGTTYYEPLDPKGDEFFRRTVYRFSPRGGRSSLLDTFDCPDPSSAAPRRSVTTTPLQSLSLMNSAETLRLAERFADRVREAIADEPLPANSRTPDRNAQNLQATTAWRLALCRTPDDDELQWSVELIDRHGLASLARALLNSNEFVVID